jgi:hypothetical protein
LPDTASRNAVRTAVIAWSGRSTRFCHFNTSLSGVCTFMVCHQPFSMARRSWVALRMNMGVESSAAEAMPALAARNPEAPCTIRQPGLPVKRAVASRIEAAVCSWRTPT